MEFICVLSVGGSLASYTVQKELENKFKAVLRSNNGTRNDIPPEFLLEKTGDGWKAQPWHEEIVSSLAHAIESSR